MLGKLTAVEQSLQGMRKIRWRDVGMKRSRSKGTVPVRNEFSMTPGLLHPGPHHLLDFAIPRIWMSTPNCSLSLWLSDSICSEGAAVCPARSSRRRGLAWRGRRGMQCPKGLLESLPLMTALMLVSREPWAIAITWTDPSEGEAELAAIPAWPVICLRTRQDGQTRPPSMLWIRFSLSSWELASLATMQLVPSGWREQRADGYSLLAWR
jgi:hypothetical protein